eukprot:gene6124-7630_t
MVIVGIFRDFRASHKDFGFECPLNTNPGVPLVKYDMDPIKKSPIYWGGNATRICETDGKEYSNEELFNQWFTDVPGVNERIDVPLIFTRNLSAPDPRVFQYENHNFFPIDNMGFENRTKYPNATRDWESEMGTLHNYLFCMELHTSFTYQGGEVLTFGGDDDIWIFINNRMVLDGGGLHAYGQADLYLDRLVDHPLVHLQKNHTASLDVYYCERRPLGSEIFLSSLYLQTNEMTY